MRKTLEERFWSKVDVRGPDECWPWKAGTNKGYGTFKAFGRTVPAHRIAYELVKGPIPPGLDVLHKCDNRPCCNPAHLWPGTDLDNAQDRDSKGRGAYGERNGSRIYPERLWRGEKHGRAKLTDHQVKRIRGLSSDGRSQRSIAKEFGVSQANIWYILRGLTWR